ncbi:phage major capsid protein [Polynucleobacter sp. es-GGE-1]|jgi:HK97 family phage prohead protease/HK97 family phage major capsid protein|uniref:phage major capsid protein n=1 Tax=Polynucleobacter sp. es-GGE-1 TaxID=1819724 RepID=UPI001C0ABB13|nr:phage major capsid protein [Polynucleobacter sp. es-GGE-1]MBU3635804.1 phage major capsid protein [Polynucleobacter sp. es-GGE-1]
MNNFQAEITKSESGFSFIASTPSIDRVGDSVSQDFNLEKYMQNPVVLFGHDHSAPIGKCTSARYENGNLIADIELAPTAKGQEIKTLIDHGTLRAVSIGFAPGQAQENSKGGMDLSSNELLEISIVAVPANPDALRIKSNGVEPAAPLDCGPQTAQLDSTNQLPNSENQMETLDIAAVIGNQEKSIFAQVKDNLATIKAGQNFTATKALSGTNTDATTGAQLGLPAQFVGNIGINRQIPNLLRSLVSSYAANGQAVSFARIGITSAAANVKELGNKPESTPSAELVTKQISTFAHHISVSKQILDDDAGLQALLSSQMILGLSAKIEAELWAEIAANSTPFVPSATVGADQIAEAGFALTSQGAQGVIVAVNPSDYFVTMTAKASGSGEYLGLPSLPYTAVPVAAVPAGKILAFEPASVAFFDRQVESVMLGYTGNQFTQNALTVLAENRGAAAVLNPNLVLVGSLTKGK